MQSLDYVGRKLVIFRTEEGHVALADAHCPHLGAHLGVGGKVVGSALRCPFHGWEWDYGGRCRSIPYSKLIPPNARLRTYPVIERNGAVWFWYHPRGIPPEFEVPVIPEWGSPEYGAQWDHHTWVIRAHPQDILENGIDFPHVMTVHGFDAPSDVVSSFKARSIVGAPIRARKSSCSISGARTSVSESTPGALACHTYITAGCSP